MRNLPDDVTTDPLWEAEHSNRLLGYEILRRSIDGRTLEIEPGRLGEIAAMDKGVTFRILQRIKASLK